MLPHFKREECDYSRPVKKYLDCFGVKMVYIVDKMQVYVTIAVVLKGLLKETFQTM